MTKLPSFNKYDNSSFKDINKLLDAAKYLVTFDTSLTNLQKAIDTVSQKVNQHIKDLETAHQDIPFDQSLSKFKDEAEKELKELYIVKALDDLKKLHSVRLMFMLIGDWKLLTQESQTATIKSEIDRQFKELGIQLPK